MTNVRHPQLSGLGRNPATPDDLLVRLAAHAAGRHGISLRRGRLADTVVEALLEHGGSESAIHLNGERISTRMRNVIAEHPDPAIRHAHANFVRDLVDLNSSLGIESLEETFGESRSNLVDSPDPKLRAAVADTWADRPLAVHLRLLADPDPLVRAAATLRRHPGVPVEWRERCLTDPATRVNVARYVPLTVKQATELISSGDLEACRAVAANPELPAEAVELLIELDDPQVRVAVAYSRHIDADTRDRLFALVAAEADAGSIAAYVALCWNFDEPGWLREVPITERLAYLDCPHPPFRRVLASCRDLPDAAWERLDNDPDLRVRRYAAARPDAPAAVLERLVRTGGAMFHIRPPIVEHPNFPRHRLRAFADDPDPHIRYIALEDPDLPTAVLERLAADSEAFIRRGAARHAHATPALLEQLLADADPEVVDEAAANPQLPLGSMRRILDESAL
ncbi:hypothetical protein O7543_01600 [Solwaraspora sp. WMMA2080]|uniref:hypothetical protein n=1 Tax=unclassified Solwaraspora TaxID=2627926 RepID=UPI00248C943C|nr:MULTISPECIES: hypothetical protein [unclassified Solwaraspora]WBB94892.1 hypothetical protein O7553_15770 [Solwaraspora sp. WMMA2059]WBC21224.1 hypothetical protein O7543_01600 [Solwaraspora sp. WMMA2080]